MKETIKYNWLARIWEKVRYYIEQEVPESLSTCEFNCRQTVCSSEKWLNCERRKEYERLSQTITPK